MAQRPTWRGYLKLSLVSCPVALHPAVTASEKVSFHLLNAKTGHRLKQQYVDAETGALVERDERLKGYEIAKDDYVAVTDDELSDVQIESSHAMDIESFVPIAEIDPIFLDGAYYVTPDDKVGEEAFAVIREAMRARAVVGLARVVLFGRERLVIVEPRARGLLATTLHYPHEVRSDAPYFDEIPKPTLGKDLLELASHIIDTKKGKFDPAAFTDRYQDAVLALIDSKRSGKPVAAVKPAQPSNVVNLMDALRASLGNGSAPKNAGGDAAQRKREPAARKDAKPRKTSKAAAKPTRRKAG